MNSGVYSFRLVRQMSSRRIWMFLQPAPVFNYWHLTLYPRLKLGQKKLKLEKENNKGHFKERSIKSILCICSMFEIEAKHTYGFNLYHPNSHV